MSSRRKQQHCQSKAMLTDYAKRNGFHNVRIFIDDGVSGVTFKRDGFKEI
jgi:DNA invertase Pin-like site-specific DNA recombinase